ncbi:ABC transporter permease [Streptomyces sp. NPDC002537]
MLRLAWLTVRARKAGFAGAFAALAFALTLITACGVLLESALGAPEPTERYAAADVVVAGSHRIAPAQPVLDRLRALPTVSAVTPEFSFPASVITRGGEVLDGPGRGPSLGHSWQSAALGPFTLRSGRAPAAADEVALDAALADRAAVRTGAPVTLATTGPPRAYTVVGVASSPLAEPRQAAVFFSQEQAVRLAGGGQPVDAVGLRAKPGVSAENLAGQVREIIEKTSSGASQLYASDVRTGGRRGEAEFAHIASPSDALGSFAGTFGVIALFVALFTVSATLALSVRQRTREIGLLRAIAATPRQVRRMIAAETLIVTLAAALPGLPAGAGLAALLRIELARRGVIPDDFPLRIGPAALLTVLALGIVAAQLAVLIAARRASRVHPAQVLSEASAPARRAGLLRAVAGAVVVAVAAVPLVSTARSRSGEGAGTADGMVMVLMLGVALLGPVLARAGGTLLGAPVAKLFPVGGFLAGAGVRVQYRRLAAAVTPLVLAVSFGGTLLFVPPIKAQAAQDQERQRLLATHVVRSSGIGIPGEFAAEARSVPGVEAVSGLMPITTVLTAEHHGHTQTHGGPGYGVDPGLLKSLLDLDVRSGSLSDLQGRGIALGERRARTLGVAVGDTVAVDWEDGTRSDGRVVAVYGRDKGFADVLTARGLAAPHTPGPLDGTVLLRASATADPRAVGQRLDALAARYPMARPQDRAAYDRGRHAQHDASNSFALFLLAMIGSFTAIAVVNTLAMSTMDRAEEFAALRLVGATRRHIMRMMCWEAVIVVALALLLGSAVGAAVLVPVSLALTGSAVPALPGAQLLGILAAAAGLGIVTTLLTTRLALRAAPSGVAVSRQ